jgi:vitamin B12 transporter
LCLFFPLTSVFSQETEEDYRGRIVVTPRTLPESLEKTAHSVEIVDGDELRDRVDRNVSEGIRLLPGVFVEVLGTRGETVNVRIRGATGQDTLVLLDGVRLNDPATNDTNLSLIPIDLIERIEVLQGSQAVLYGGSSVGGVVNIITKRGTDDDEFRLAFEGGNLGYKRGALAWTGSNQSKSLRYSLGVSGTGATGQFDNDGFTEAALTQRWDIVPTEKLSITLTSHILLSRKELARGFLIGPAPLYDPTLPMDAFFVQITRDFNRFIDTLLTTESLNLVYDWNDRFRTEFLYGFLLSDQEEQDSNAGDPGSLTPSGILLAPNSVLNNSKGVRQSANLRQYFFLPKMGAVEQTVFAGFEFYDERVRQGGQPFPGDLPPDPASLGPFIPPVDPIPAPGVPGDRQNYAPYFQYHLAAYDRFFMDAGFRWDVNSAYGNELSPRVAMAVLIPEIDGKIHGVYGEGFLPPTLVQLFNPIAGNPDLKPQKSQSYEAGYTQFIKDRAVIYATFFYLDFDNLINRVGTNSDDAYSTGVETGFEVRVIPQLRLGGNYTFTRTREESQGNVRIPGIPDNVFNATLLATPWRTLRVDSSLSYVSDRREEFPVISDDGRFVGGTPAATLMGGTVGGYTLWNLGVSYEFEIFNVSQSHPQSIRIYGKANNILNNSYEVRFGFPVPGFNFIGGAEVLF